MGDGERHPPRHADQLLTAGLNDARITQGSLNGSAQALGRPARKPAKKPLAKGVRDLSAHATGTTIAQKADAALRKTAST